MNKNVFIGLVKWSLLRHKFYIPMFVLVQIVLSFAITYGFLFITNATSEQEKLYLSTGALVINVIALTCVLAPQIISEAKQNGIFEYQKTLPVSRFNIVFADILIWGMLSLVGIMTSIIISVLYFDIELNITFLGIFNLFFVVFVLLLLGFALAYLLPANLMAMITQVIMLGALLFSPIIYSAERLPIWAGYIYNNLPFVPASNIIRQELFNLTNVNLKDYIIVAGWGIISFIAIMWILIRRK